MLRYLPFVVLALSACTRTPPPVLPLRPSALPSPQLTLVWVGRGEAERYVDGRWERTPSFDYQFSVIQRRYAERWESVKELHRVHADYDGSAGARDQTYYFRLDFEPMSESEQQVAARVRSTLGAGHSRSDRSFREAEVVLEPDISALAPFDTYRIRQIYDYEGGELRETVELLDHDDGHEIPWVRVRERAQLFAQHRYPSPPTTR